MCDQIDSIVPHFTLSKWRFFFEKFRPIIRCYEQKLDNFHKSVVTTCKCQMFSNGTLLNRFLWLVSKLQKQFYLKIWIRLFVPWTSMLSVKQHNEQIWKHLRPIIMCHFMKLLYFNTDVIKSRTTTQYLCEKEYIRMNERRRKKSHQVFRTWPLTYQPPVL